MNDDLFPWLLEGDNLGVRYLALRDILELPDEDQELVDAEMKADQVGPISQILDEMEDEGYWVEPDPGYSPKYRSTVWSIIMLAQLGASVNQGVDFLFSVDPATAANPSGWDDKHSRNWWRFGFPVFYVTDILQIVEVLVRLGYAEDIRLANTINIIKEKQDSQDRWHLEYDYKGKTWVDFREKKQPNKWVTLRALWALKNSINKPDRPITNNLIA